VRAKAPQIAQGDFELVVTAVFLMGYYRPNSSTCSTGSGLPEMRCFKVCPSRNSMTMKVCPFSSSISWMVQMFA
jgi:hypothetical protein